MLKLYFNGKKKGCFNGVKKDVLTEENICVNGVF